MSARRLVEISGTCGRVKRENLCGLATQGEGNMLGIIVIVLAVLVTLGLAFQTEQPDNRRKTNTDGMGNKEGIFARDVHPH